MVSGTAYGTPSSPDDALASSVVRVTGRNGTLSGAGFLVAADLVLTCAHVVSDALDQPRHETVPTGKLVNVELPLAERREGVGPGVWSAEVEHWVPIRAGHAGDIAVLRLREPIPSARPLPMADAASVWDHGARAVGFTGGEPGETWFRGRLSGVTSEGWFQLSRADGQAAHVQRGFSGSPVWDNELGAVVGLLVAAQPQQDAQQAYVLRTRSVLREVPSLASVVSPPTPFRGLAPFQEHDADVYFGRDTDIERVVTALRGADTAVTLYGPSGCGKSSLALAGVAPRMRQAGYEVFVVNAGQVSSLRSALATELHEAVRTGRFGPRRAESVDQVEAWLADKGLTDTLHRLRGMAVGRPLIVLDQAEALVDRTDAELGELVELLFPDRPPATAGRVLLTLRADFMNAALEHPRLGPVLRGGTTLPLTPMSRDQLREVITKPVETVPAVEYDPGLAGRVLNDTGGEPGVLPLLGFVLEQLWEHQVAGRLLATTYENIGGVSGALRRHAETAWRQCVISGDEAEALALLTGLVRVLPGGEAPLRRRLTRDEAGEDRWRLAQSLAERRLLVLYGGEGRPESVELAHDALITAWPTLSELVRADADFLASRAEVQHDLERWRKADSPVDLLPGALQLAALEGRLRGREKDLTEEQRNFLTLARRRRQARRARVRAGWIAVGSALVLIAGLGTFLAQESRVSAERAAKGQSRSLAIQSDELTDSNPAQAGLAALAAYDIAPTQEARSALMRRYAEMKGAAWVLAGAQGKLVEADVSDEGTVALVTSVTGRATLFVRTADGSVRHEQLRFADDLLSPVVSSDGSRIAYVRGEDGGVVWHDVTPTGKRLAGPMRTLRGALLEPDSLPDVDRRNTMDFSPDSRYLVGASVSTRPMQLWDLTTGRPRALPKQFRGLESVWFGPDEKTVVAERGPLARPSLVKVDIATGAIHELSRGAAVAVSGNAEVAVSCTGTGPETRFRVVRASDGQVLRTVSMDKYKYDCALSDIAVDGTGDYFAVVNNSSNYWDLVSTHPGIAPRTYFLGPDPLSYSNRTEDSATVDAPPFLVGTPHSPTLVTNEGNALKGWARTLYDDSTDPEPQLLGDGSRMVIRARKEGADLLRVVETEGEGGILSEVESSPAPEPYVPLEVNAPGTLVADVLERHRVVVRALPSLRRVAEFRTANPPAAEPRKRPAVFLSFHGDNRIVTTSGSVVESWDARSGQRLSRPIDLRDVRLTKKDRSVFTVRDHPEPGFVSVTVAGESYMHAVDLRTGKPQKKLRVRLADDLYSASFLADPKYVTVLTTAQMAELWSVHPGRPARRVAGPFGPLTDHEWSQEWSLRPTEGAGFFLAYKGSIHFLKADEPGYQDIYEFGEEQAFPAATGDGKAILRDPANLEPHDLLRLDPALWKRHVCKALGRELTADERRGLILSVPADICPS
ncbi:trypsin-like peptidase domain-containing protein [Streptomyces sp. IB2014 016-6]|uniref:nSTAND1 domain-containing NTPase n=1 Tax=Streptomyces sp. IB2014 016-6 TaxID=2517818 RepID=UPI0011CB0767|nr:trypsin-like peptidase domain-containing protein [Streptomyces sp. IB2014 016-6]TXL86617.1 serine protease [Streptomyces sp. IB2014 016-6]